MQYSFYTCDVFTNTRFGGNPLAVLPNAEGLSGEQMQQIAREFNFSESTFVLPAEQGHTKRVRIFTPTTEVPFAGHPNVGTAFVLASMGEFGDFDETSVVFEEKAGPVPVTINKSTGGIRAELKAPNPLSIGEEIPIELVASALSLESDAIVVTTHRPQLASVGLPFVMVEVKDRDALEQARIHMPAFDTIFQMGIMPDIHVYIHTQDDCDIRTRMFAPLDGVPEDPATGSANCALVAMLTHYKPESGGAFSWKIVQGVEMNRPSFLDARTQKSNDEVTGVWIAGECVMVTQGTIEID